jgi:hypothetical protein
MAHTVAVLPDLWALYRLRVSTHAGWRAPDAVATEVFRVG